MSIKRKNIIIVVIAIFLIAAAGLGIFLPKIYGIEQHQNDMLKSIEEMSNLKWSKSVEVDRNLAIEEINVNMQDKDYFTQEELNLIQVKKNDILKSTNIHKIKEIKNEANEIIAQADLRYEEEQIALTEAEIFAQEIDYVVEEYYPTVNYNVNYNSGNNSDLYSSGVIYEDGNRYTWYSSNTLHHYRTNEWTAGSDGIYRDNNGYIVVATSAGPNGEIVNTPYGKGKSYDTCPGGAIDIYTNF